MSQSTAIFGLLTEQQFGIVQMILYFGILIFSFVLVMYKFPGKFYKHGSIVTFLVFQAVADLAFTWYYIFDFIIADVKSFKTWEEWMDKGDLFYKAYALVTEEPGRWFWSSQLLCWVLVGVMFMVLEGYRLNISHIWAYVVIGFLGAISVAFPLFYAHVIISQTEIMSLREQAAPTKRTISYYQVSPILSLCVLLALGSVVKMPVYLKQDDIYMFKICLVIVHCVLIVPAIMRLFQGKISAMQENVRASGSFVTFMILVGLLGTWVQLYNLREFMDGLDSVEDVNSVLNILLNKIAHNSCQISITADLIMTHLATGLFCLSETGSPSLFFIYIIIGTIFSPVTATAIFLAYREYNVLPYTYGLYEKSKED